MIANRVNIWYNKNEQKYEIRSDIYEKNFQAIGNHPCLYDACFL